MKYIYILIALLGFNLNAGVDVDNPIFLIDQLPYAKKSGLTGFEYHTYRFYATKGDNVYVDLKGNHVEAFLIYGENTIHSSLNGQYKVENDGEHQIRIGLMRNKAREMQNYLYEFKFNLNAKIDNS